MVNLLRFSLGLLFAFGQTAGLKAQQYQFQQFGTPQGLPSSEVYGLHINHKGYVWAFTNYGIVKHNGERFVKVCNNLPFLRSFIYANSEDAMGNLYLANSKAEIFRIRNDSAFIIDGLKKLSEEIVMDRNIIYNFHIDDTSIIISTNQSTYLVDLKHKGCYKNITRQYSKDTLVIMQRSPSNYIACNTVTREGKGEEEFRKTVNVLLLNATSKEYFKLPVLNRRSSRHFIERRKDMIYIMFLRQIFLINTKSGVVKSVNTNKQILNYSIDNDGNIWICFYKGGVSMFDKEGTFKKSYFEKLSITNIVLDKLNGIWVSSLENGMFYCGNKYEKHFDNIKSIGNEDITCLKTCDSTLIVGKVSGSITMINKQVLSYTLKNTGYDNNDILDVICFHGKYIIGTKNGVFIIENNKIRMLSNFRATCKQLFNGGDSVLYLTNRTVEYFKLKPFIQQYHHKVLNASLICGVYETPERLLLGTDKGLYTFHLYNEQLTQHALHDKIITRIYTDKYNNKWICTKGDGLYKIASKGNTLHIKNIPSEFINDITIKDNSIVVLSTNTGIYYTLLEDVGKPFWINIYNNETVNITFFKGKLFAGTKSGLVSFENNVFFTYLQPAFYLNSIKVNGKEKNVSTGLQLQYNENSVMFDYDYLNFNAYKQLAYDLNGPIKLSGIIGVTDISFQNLSSGTYTITASPLSHSMTKPVSVSYVFTIKPAFWQTAPFFITVGVWFIILTLLIFLFILKKREKKRRKIFEIEKQLAEQKLTALKAQINPHFISNSLSSIQQLIHAEEIDKAGKYIAMFSIFIRTVLNLSDRLLVPLIEEIKIIELYVELEQLRFTNEFEFIKTISPDIDISYTSIPPLITQPLIENAIWHGLLRLNNVRKPVLKLHIYKEDKNVIIEIEDNGIGRKKNDNPNRFKISKGTELIRSRIENLNKIHPELNVSFSIKDLLDAAGGAAGTKVSISINRNI